MERKAIATIKPLLQLVRSGALHSSAFDDGCANKISSAVASAEDIVAGEVAIQ